MNVIWFLDVRNPNQRTIKSSRWWCKMLHAIFAVRVIVFCSLPPLSDSILVESPFPRTSFWGSTRQSLPQPPAAIYFWRLTFYGEENMLIFTNLAADSKFGWLTVQILYGSENLCSQQLTICAVTKFVAINKSNSDGNWQLREGLPGRAPGMGEWCLY